MGLNKPYVKINERNYVEKPFLDELEKLGWTIIDLDKDVLKRRQVPMDSFRNNFSEVILQSKLVEALKKINPWMEKDQIDEVIKKIANQGQMSLIEANEKIHSLYVENTTVNKNRKTNQVSPTVRYIDFRNPVNNNYTAISQFKVRILGSENHIIPDITLFINGLPITVIECKSPKTKEPIPEAIDQILRYSEQRGEIREGNKKLFFYNLFVIATCRNKCKFGTISSHISKHFFRWTDPYPKTVNQIITERGEINDQIRLIHGMLSIQNLLDLIKIYTMYIFNEKEQKIKIVARYQQFRAVKLIINRLLEGKNKVERSGIVWHTQGSGKSLTMMFAVCEMYNNLKLKNWKVVFITDRTNLENQLANVSKGLNYSVKVANSIDKLKELLINPSSDLVMGMIHKFQEKGINSIFPTLNESPNILIMIDEAHRTQYSKLAANLDKALPNATEIAYTGTPIDKTEKKYKYYIDKYTMRQSIDDGVTLEILYEGRTHTGEITDKKAMDIKFADVFTDYNLEEKLKILGYGSRLAYLEAKEIIKAKARDMVRHFVFSVFSNEFKAQIVASSREAAVRYKTAIDEAMKEIIKELEKDNPFFINIELLKKVETACIISGDHNDKPYIKKHTKSSIHKKQIKNFKLPYRSKKDKADGKIGIIIVNNMLLIGFDAPIEQVMYLDKVIIAHNLLQAIARVNRVYNEYKQKGIIIDYVGIGHHLKLALDNFDEKEQREIIDSLGNEEDALNDLISVHRRMLEFFQNYNITSLTDFDAIYDLFYDEDIRQDFIDLFKEFSSKLDLVYPKKKALDYVQYLKQLSEVVALAEMHFRDKRFSMKGIPAKLRIITDEYLKSKGIEQKVAPISIIDEEFTKNLKKYKRNRTKAAEIEHAIRHYISKRYFEDPELYASLAEVLEKILEENVNNWDLIYVKLEELREKIKNIDNEETYGLHKKKQMPFYRILRKELYDEDDLTDVEISKLVCLTQVIYMIIERELKRVDFWANLPAIMKLKEELLEQLISEEYYTVRIFENRNKIISRVMEVAEKNNDIIL